MSKQEERRGQLTAALRKEREKRDAIVEQAQMDFDGALTDAYLKGLSLNDLHLATGVAVSTLRSRLRSAGITLRGVGKPYYEGKT